MAPIRPKRKKPKTDILSVRTPVEMIGAVERIAKTEGRQLSPMCVLLLHAGLLRYFEDRGESVPVAISELDLSDF